MRRYEDGGVSMLGMLLLMCSALISIGAVVWGVTWFFQWIASH